MKIFDDPGNVLEVGQKAAGLRIDGDLCLSDLAGYPLFFVFWKSL